MSAPRRLRIGFVLDDSFDSNDGVQQYVRAVGGWLSGQGHEVHYLVGQSRTTGERVHVLSRNVAVRFNGNRLSMPLPAPRAPIRQLLQAVPFDVLHVQMPYSPFMAGRVIRLAPSATAVIGTFHILPQNRFVTLASWLLGCLEWRTLRRFDTVFAVSAAAARFAGRTFKLPCPVLPNAVDVGRFATARPFGRPAGCPTVLFLGRLVPRKGCQVLLKALAIIRQRYPELAFRGLICGGGPLDAELRYYARTNGLADHVEFTGFVDEADKPRFYASADITVFPSSGGESFGIVLVEAMASGRSAVLAGDNPGYRSVMAARPDQLFPPLEAETLAERIAHFLQDNTARQAAAVWGKAHARQFDAAVIGRALEAAYTRRLQPSQTS